MTLRALLPLTILSLLALGACGDNDDDRTGDTTGEPSGQAGTTGGQADGSQSSAGQANAGQANAGQAGAQVGGQAGQAGEIPECGDELLNPGCCEQDARCHKTTPCGTLTFRSLCGDSPDTLTTVARFLSLLELFREGAVAFDQVTPLGELTVRWTGDDEVDVEDLDLDVSLPESVIVSVGHRSTLDGFHDRILELRGGGRWAVTDRVR